MPRSSTLENPTAVTPAAGATDVIEAATAEAAIAEVHTRLGPDARIVDACRVLRGGIGGFFAKEVVQLHATRGTAPATADDLAVTDALQANRMSNLSSPARGGTSPWEAVLRSSSAHHAEPDASSAARDHSPVDRLLEDANEAPDTIDFATFLRRQFVDEPSGSAPPSVVADPVAPADPVSAAAPAVPVDAGDPVPAAAPAVPVDAGDPVPAAAPAVPVAAVARPVDPPAVPGGEAAPAPAEGPPWSTGVLLALGLPVELVRGLDVEDAADDLAWTTGLATALRPSCRPLPGGPSVLLGPHAHLVGEVDGAPAARSETWLKALRGGRWLHLVVGGDGWRAPLADRPLAVSWARPADLPDALRCAVELGLVLGYGPMGGCIRRARPLDVALAVRDLVDAR